MQIHSAKYLISSPSVDKCPPADRPEFAFIGRSNVGKSSLINMLCKQSKLAKTSATPGKTQLINHFIVNNAWYLVDLPGYGYAKVSQSQRRSFGKMISHYLQNRENLVMVFVLLDARHTPQKIDLEFVNQLGAWEVPFTLVFTKADKETQAIVAKNVKAFLDKMRETWQFLPASIVTSAVKGQGRDKLLGLVDESVASWSEAAE
jgi:GTP-binding protein